ncbi:hypothetical protein ACFRAR_11150 [Kitasatospora sp. NPDC056651]|uniref:hypothetical protein n=1 Tax=Kitasatospora sp. NPDC056651 TaxID=3345892 RepID=UPI00369DDD34
MPATDSGWPEAALDRLKRHPAEILEGDGQQAGTQVRSARDAAVALHEDVVHPMADGEVLFGFVSEVEQALAPSGTVVAERREQPWHRSVPREPGELRDGCRVAHAWFEGECCGERGSGGDL